MEVIELGRRRVHTKKVRKEELKTNYYHFAYLPNEIVVMIFSLLPKESMFKVPQVCRKWNHLYLGTRSWLLREKLWKVQSNKQPPSPRLCHSCVADEENLYVIGGDDGANHIGTIKNDITVFNFETKEWKSLGFTLPVSLTESSAVVHDGMIYLFGGITVGNRRTNSILQINTKSREVKYIDAKGPTPSPSSCHASVMHNNKFYMFGGWNPTFMYNDSNFSEFFEFDFETHTWRELPQKGDIPTKRRALKSFVHNNEFYIFGGFTSQAVNDFYKYNFESCLWTKVTTKGQVPSGRSRYALAKKGDRVLLLGGFDGEKFLSDMFELELDTMTWKCWKEEKYPVIGQHAAVVHKDKMFIFGGNSGEVALNDFLACYIE